MPRGSRVALVGFPCHANAGDHAIWLGALSGLADLDCRVAYTCSFHTYDPGALRRSVGPGPIVFTGGGNLGDLYPEEQALREAVLMDFPDSPVVQLPQSIHFEAVEARERAAQVMRRHARLTLMVRDAASARIASEHLGIEPVLAPDCAFLLGPLLPAAPPTHPVALIVRDDIEGHGAGLEGLPIIDWMDDTPPLGLRVIGSLSRRAWADPRARALYGRAASAGYRAIARNRLRRAVAAVGSARAVVSNRLHVHVLALLLGVRHVMVDTAQGKISGFLDTWTGASELVRTAADFEDGYEIARRWIEETTEVRR